MTVTWILERDVFPDTVFDGMCGHLCERELPHHAVSLTTDHRIDGRKPVVSGPVVVYGSIGVQTLATREGWQPGVFANPAAFNQEAYGAALGGMLLNPDAQRMPLTSVGAFVRERYPGAGAAFFIKPNDDTKEFAGTVKTAAEFEQWLSNLLASGYLESTDFDVVVSDCKSLGREWRVVVVDGGITAASLYREDGQARFEAGTIAAVEALVMAAHARFSPAAVYVIDVAEAAEGLRIVEYNTFNSASLYACDPAAVIDGVTAYVERLSI